MLENAAVIVLSSFALLILAYFTYGRFIGRRVYQLDANRRTPAHALEDGVDYVPTQIPVLFGHHFASIAGLGPILGPAIAVIWGWLPAVLWVLIGSIFIGAVHDLGALRVSLRYQGRSIGDVCRHVMGPRARLLALLIIFFLMSLAMGAFCNTLADLFLNYNPDAIIPSFGLMVVAVAVGIAVYKLKFPLGLTTIVALAIFAGLILWGVEQPVPTYQWFGSAETRAALETAWDNGELARPYGAAAAIEHLKAAGNEAAVKDLGSIKIAGSALWRANYAWIGGLLAYAFVASVLPVWLLLQPRDYINSFQLYFALATMLIGLTIAGIVGAPENHIEAEMVRTDVPGAPSMFPFLFVTIACGAVSGFHALVSSGTTVKQLNRETDALPIGYGAMLTEGALAVLVIIACVAGLNASEWREGGTYASWSGISGAGLAVQLRAMFHGGAAFLSHLYIPESHGRTFLAVTVVAFALTTLDSATRLLRFNVEEICRSLRLDFLANRYFASLVAVSGISFFALVPAGKTLWMLFGTTNQLLAGLTLLTVSVFLFKISRPVIYTLLPMALMLVVSMWAMVESIPGFFRNANLSDTQAISLTAITLVVMAMSLWLILEAILSFARGRGGLDFEEKESQAVTLKEPAAIGPSQTDR
jgi:carbon starvation protein